MSSNKETHKVPNRPFKKVIADEKEGYWGRWQARKPTNPEAQSDPTNQAVENFDGETSSLSRRVDGARLRRRTAKRWPVRPNINNSEQVPTGPEAQSYPTEETDFVVVRGWKGSIDPNSTPTEEPKGSTSSRLQGGNSEPLDKAKYRPLLTGDVFYSEPGGQEGVGRSEIDDAEIFNLIYPDLNPESLSPTENKDTNDLELLAPTRISDEALKDWGLDPKQGIQILTERTIEVYTKKGEEYAILGQIEVQIGQACLDEGKPQVEGASFVTLGDSAVYECAYELGFFRFGKITPILKRTYPDPGADDDYYLYHDGELKSGITHLTEKTNQGMEEVREMLDMAAGIKYT